MSKLKRYLNLSPVCTNPDCHRRKKRLRVAFFSAALLLVRQLSIIYASFSFLLLGFSVLTLKSLFLVLILLLGGSFPLKAYQQAEVFVAGSDYRLVESASLDTVFELTQLQQVSDIELFYWYGCASCQQIEQALAEYLDKNPHLVFRRTPLVARINWRPQAYIQPILTQLGETGVTQDQIYQQCVQDCNKLGDFESIKAWLANRAGLSELPLLNEAAIWQAEKSFRKRAAFYSVTHAPTILVRESFATDANMAGSATRLIKIIDYLIEKTDNP